MIISSLSFFTRRLKEIMDEGYLVSEKYKENFNRKYLNK